MGYTHERNVFLTLTPVTQIFQKLTAPLITILYAACCIRAKLWSHYNFLQRFAFGFSHYSLLHGHRSVPLSWLTFTDICQTIKFDSLSLPARLEGKSQPHALYLFNGLFLMGLCRKYSEFAFENALMS